MIDQPTEAARLLSRSIQSVSPRWTQRQRCARRLLEDRDPFARFVPASLIAEACAPRIERLRGLQNPAVLFIDRLGGGDGAHAAGGLIRAIGEHLVGASFTHVSFSTPSRGLGALLRGNLTRAGAESSVLVDVVAHNRPAEGLVMTEEEADTILAGYHLVITYAPSGAAGLLPLSERRADPLVTRSHVAVLAFPDPESLVADLPAMTAAVEAEPAMDSVRFWAMIADEDDTAADLGHCVLKKGGDAKDRLWVLLDNARRRLYHFVAEPMLDDLPAGDPLVYPCHRLLESGFVEGLTVDRVVPAGNRLLVVGSGKLVLD